MKYSSVMPLSVTFIMMDLPSHEVLQDGALSCALSPYHGDLRQVEAAALTHAAQGVLQAIDQRDKILHPPVAHRDAEAELGVGAALVSQVQATPVDREEAIMKNYVDLRCSSPTWTKPETGSSSNRSAAPPAVTGLLLLANVFNSVE